MAVNRGRAVVVKYYIQNEGIEEYANMFIMARKYISEKQVPLRDVISDFPLKH